MKTIFLSIIFLISLNSRAIDISILEENYPGFHDYEAISFTGIKTYFRTLFVKSIIYNGADGVNRIDVQDESKNTTLTIRCSIERQNSANTLIDVVKYSFPSGNSFEYTVSRKGKNLRPLSETDLLMFKFQTEDDLDSYDLLIPKFNINYHREIARNVDGFNETSYFILGMMDFNVGINTTSNVVEINRDYIYFFKKMNPPQQTLTINAKQNQKNWKEIEFIHSTRGAGVISPKIFFGGLNDAAGLFVESSFIYVSILNSLGFPKFN